MADQPFCGCCCWVSGVVEETVEVRERERSGDITIVKFGLKCFGEASGSSRWM